MDSKTFEALGYLQNYADASEKAHGELKSCMWQLTKSRRNVRSGIIGVDSTTAYTAELLREELRAQMRVTTSEPEIDLVDEDASPEEKDSKDRAPQWKLQDVVAEMEKPSSAQPTSESEKKKDTGMRNRKNAGKEDTKPSSSSWTMIEEEEDYDIEEDEKILRTDPIKLFGGYFPALELKKAQKNAREALNGYIEAANEAAKLLELLQVSEKA